MTVYKDGKGWVAEDGKYRVKAQTRRDALAGLQQQHDMAALDIPELRAIQKRWVLAIEAIIPGLDPDDAYTRMWLLGLQSNIEGFEAMARVQALGIEERIRELRDRAAKVKEITS